MAHVNDEIMKIVRNALDLLRANNIPIQQAFLFGSYAAGSEHEWSDIDLALVSEAFSEDRFRERLRIMQITGNVDSRIEPSPFNPEQFTELDPFVWEIKNRGIEIRF